MRFMSLPSPGVDRELTARPPGGSGGASAEAGIEVPRVIGRVQRTAGPTLVVVGGLHGNEPAGALALTRMFAGLDARHQARFRGSFVGLAGNVQALARKQRFLRDDLNRIWLPDRLRHVRGASGPLDAEDAELRELDRQLTVILAEAPGPVTVLDVHGVSGPGPAFVTLDDTLSNRRLAFRIPSPCVLGLEEELQGTLTEYLVGLGIVSFGFESGQCDDPRSVDRAEAAVWILLDELRMLEGREWPQVTRARQLLRRESASLPAVVEVRHRHAVAPADAFTMRPGFLSFQPVQRGQMLADDARGPVSAPFDAHLLMPLYQAQGSDGFFLVRPVRRAWLSVSSVARRLPLQPLLGWLPGVERDPARGDVFVVDTHKARWLALPLFHLLGFKRRQRLPHRLVMRRRGR